MTEWATFNANDTVRVKLNENGREELKRQTRELNEFILARSPTAKPLPDLTIDPDGYWTTQLWDLMNRFGHMMRMDLEPPFDLNIGIRLDDISLAPTARSAAAAGAPAR